MGVFVSLLTGKSNILILRRKRRVCFGPPMQPDVNVKWQEVKTYSKLALLYSPKFQTHASSTLYCREYQERRNCKTVIVEKKQLESLDACSFVFVFFSHFSYFD